MRARTNISLKSQKQAVFDDFRGADFSSSPMRVSPSRATEMQNFICDSGINRKRNGWREVANFRSYNSDDKTYEALQINGIYDLPNINKVIVHAADRLCMIDREKLESAEPINFSGLAYLGFGNNRSVGIYHKGTLYILTGEEIVSYYYEAGTTKPKFQNISDYKAYVPTTTISINALDAEGVPKGTQETFESVNLLTRRRKNALVGDVVGSKYQLDGDIDNEKPVKISGTSINGSFTYIIPAGEKSLTVGKDVLISIDLNVSPSTITFNFDTTPAVSGEHNIIVEFYDKGSNTVDVGKCTFGMTFGADGNTDRLFLGGHPDYPNVDFYSEQDNFFYFPAGNQTTIGAGNSRIVGYARLSDSVQVIYKEENPHESTIYYRTGTNRAEYDENGNLKKFDAVFKLTAGAIGEGVISGRACKNFAGDVLMLSSNGVYGIVVGDNVATSERYAKERSRSVNSRLTAHGKDKLQNAESIVYKNRYYLALDGVCYVADARYKYVPDGSVDGAFNYEWWYWTNIPARVFAEIDGKLYFGTEDGKLCVFDDEYTDRDKHYSTNSGDLLVKTSGDTIINEEESAVVEDNLIYCNTKLLCKITEGDTVVFSGLDCGVMSDGRKYAGILAFVGEFIFTESSERIYTDENTIKTIYCGMEVYADHIYDANLEVVVKYLVTDIDRGDNSFILTNEDGAAISLNARRGSFFRLSRKIDGEEFIVTSLTDESFKIATKRNGELKYVRLIKYATNYSGTWAATFTHHENIPALWVTPIMDLGTNVFNKTLLKMTISVEPEDNGVVRFGYETRISRREKQGRSLNSFSFEDMSFEDFTFETKFASSYTVRVKERNFNYIVFRFISDDKYPCAINNFTATYKINGNNRGVM